MGKIGQTARFKAYQPKLGTSKHRCFVVAKTNPASCSVFGSAFYLITVKGQKHNVGFPSGFVQFFYYLHVQRCVCQKC